MKRRNFLTLAAVSATLTGCSTLRALGQIDQIGPARQALIDYLPEVHMIGIRADLQFLDDTLAEVMKVLKKDPDVSLTDVVLLALGSPAAFTLVGQAYSNIRSAVEDYETSSNEPIPAQLTAFHSAMSPAYSQLRKALEANDRLKRGAELATLLRPIAILAL